MNEKELNEMEELEKKFIVGTAPKEKWASPSSKFWLIPKEIYDPLNNKQRVFSATEM